MARVPSGTEYLDAESVRRIFDRLNQLGMKRIDLARSLGFANGAYMTRLEKGELRIRKDHIAKWATALQTTPEYILGLTEEANDVKYLSKNDRQLRMFRVFQSTMSEDDFKLWMKIGQEIMNAKHKG